jgi:hypothetical protein
MNNENNVIQGNAIPKYTPFLNDSGSQNPSPYKINFSQ